MARTVTAMVSIGSTTSADYEKFTSNGQVAENMSIWRSGRIMVEIVLTSLSKPW
jgi:hypothetical protein